MKSCPTLLARATLAIMLIFGIAACSLATLAYNNAHAVLCYALDDYFDLSEEQREWLKPRVDAFVAWHRHAELPQYQRLLNDAQARARESVTASDIENLYGESKLLLARLADKAMPDMVGFVTQLSPAQLRYLEKKFGRDNARMERDLRQSPEKRQRLRAERYVDRLEDWLGRISPAQKDEIETTIAALPLLDALRLNDRRSRQSEFLRLARAGADDNTTARELRILLVTPEKLRDAAYQAEWERQQKALFALLASVVSQATPAQKARMDKRFARYAADLVSLTRGG